MSRCPTCGESFSAGQFCPRDGARLEPEAWGVAEERPEEDLLVGQVVADRFRLVSRLGSGGMGTVYVAQHLFIDKRVALKLLRPEVITNPDAMARFQREALAASTIGHKNIVTIDDCGRLPDGQIYLTMELLEGESLGQLMARRQLTLPEIWHIAIQTCHGLGAAHAKGIIHRDMKPDNILLVGATLLAKILDFGIAKIVSSGDNTNLTKTGTVFGTPNYMAPEQALGRKVDHRADVYSMGVILYEMLTGRLPFSADSFVAVLTLHVTQEPEPPRQVAPERGIPAEAEQLVLKAMAKDPDQRFQDMSQLISALLQLRQDSTGRLPMDSHLHLSQLGQPLEAQSQRVSSLQQPNTQTALAGELVDLSPPQVARRWRGLTLGLVLALLVGSGALAFWGFKRQQGEPGRRSRSTASRLATRAPAAAADTGAQRMVNLADQGALTAAAGEPTAPDQTAGADAEAPSSRAQIIIETLPPGAEIWRSGQQVGQTPELLEAEVGQQLKLELRKAGYLEQQLEFTAKTHEKKIVRLERRRAKPGRRAAASSKNVSGARQRGKTGQAGSGRVRAAPPHDHGSDHDIDQGDHGEVIEPY